MAVGDLAGIGFDIGDELVQRLGRHRRMHREAEITDRDLHDRIEVLVRIVERLCLQQRFVDVRERAAEQDGVPVGARLGDRRRAERCTGTADVLHDDRSEQRLDPVGPGPRQRIIRASGRERHDEANGPIGIRLRRSSVRKGQRRRSTSKEF
jgi:hypothetical protein